MMVLCELGLVNYSIPLAHVSVRDFDRVNQSYAHYEAITSIYVGNLLVAGTVGTDQRSCCDMMP